MHHLKILSAGPSGRLDQVACWDCPADVEVLGLARAVDRACRFLQRWGRVVVLLEAPDGAVTVVGRYA